jgi:predicted permease
MDRDLREQIESHLDEATEEHLRQGMSPEEARRAARLNFGSVVQVEEAHRQARGPWPRDLTRDVLYGLRALRRNPGFTAVAILSLAVGIGANTAIFSLVNSLLFRPRAVWNTGESGHLYEGCSYPSYAEFRDRNEVFTGLAAYGIRQFNLGDAGQVEQVWGEAVSGNYFDVLGVRMQDGRGFLPGEDAVPGRNPVVVISDGLWKRRFDSSPNLVGQTVTLNRQKLTVVGIAPPQYTGMLRGLAIEVWVPMMMMPSVEPKKGQGVVTGRGSRWLVMIGRLRPEVSVERARARFDVLSREMQASHPEEWRSWQEGSGRIRELFVTVLPERDTRIPPGMREDAYVAVALVFVIINVVLAIACMNLAGMLLARAVARRKEIAIRLALGAPPLRIVRQLVTESVLLAFIAGAAGLILTVWILDLLLASLPALPEGIRIALDLRLDWRVWVYTLGFSTLTGILFGLAPALQGSKTDVGIVLKDDANAFSSGYRKSGIRGALVVAQVACSVLLLIGAGLVLRSLEKVRPTRLGFSSDRVVVAALQLDETHYDRRRSQEFYRELSGRVAALPGVQAASLVQDMPGGFMGRSRRSTEIEGYQPASGEGLQLDATFVGPRYFTNMKVPIIQGRDFDERDREGSPCVAIVNEAFAQRYFVAAGSALGKHLAKFEETKQLCKIVGVIRDNQWQSLEKAPRPFHALAVYQAHRRQMSLLVNTEGDPASQTAAIRRTIQGLDPEMPVNDVQPLADYFSALAFPFRLLAIVIGASGVMALLLATIGIYGIVSYSVARRTREMGIRMVLGALKADIVKKVVSEGMLLVAGGLALGLLLSAALTQVLTRLIFDSSLLFGVSATDALTFAGVTILLALVALAACYIPALRATRISPIEALRYE